MIAFRLIVCWLDRDICYHDIMFAEGAECVLEGLVGGGTALSLAHISPAGSGKNTPYTLPEPQYHRLYEWVKRLAASEDVW